MTVIGFGGLTFDDGAGTGFTVSRLLGWYDAAPSRRQVRNRPQSDGAFEVDRFFRGARVVSAEGSWSGTSLAEAYAARDALMALQADGQPSVFTVSDELGSRWCTVDLAAAPSADDGLFLPHFKWAFDVVASDPRKYAVAPWESASAGSVGSGRKWPAVSPLVWGPGAIDGKVALTNSGLAPSSPSFRLLGGFTEAKITCAETGAQIVYARETPTDSVVTVDVRNRRATIDGQSDVSRFLEVREWEDVPPLSSRTFQLEVIGASGSPGLEGRVFPAWW